MNCIIGIALTVLAAFGALTGSLSAQTPSFEIELIEAHDGVRILYTASQPVRHVDLGAATAANPFARMAPSDGTHAIGERSIDAIEPVRRLEILLQPDEEVARSSYPVLSRLGGAGYVLYAPGILPVAPITGLTYRPLNGGPLELDAGAARGGYVYLGSHAASFEDFDLVFSTQTPQAFRALIERHVRSQLSFYARQMGSAPSTRALIIVDLHTAEADVNRGDVTPNQTVFLRVGRRDPDAHNFDANTVQNRRLRAFFAHELFHLWTYRETATQAGWWAHEGAAELASWFAIAEIEQDPLFVLEQVEHALNGCVDQLRTQTMREAAQIGRGSIRYSCGAVMHWFAAHRGSQSETLEAAFDLWRTLWPAPGALTGMDDFDALIFELLVDPLPHARAVFGEAGTARWPVIAEHFNSGDGYASVEARPPTGFSLKVAAAQAIARSACGEVWGVGLNDAGLFVQAPPDCATLEGSPVIRAVNGVSPTDSPDNLLYLVTDACRTGAVLAVELKREDRTDTEQIACTVAVEPPPPVFSIRERIAQAQP